MGLQGAWMPTITCSLHGVASSQFSEGHTGNTGLRNSSSDPTDPTKPAQAGLKPGHHHNEEIETIPSTIFTPARPSIVPFCPYTEKDLDRESQGVDVLNHLGGDGDPTSCHDHGREFHKHTQRISQEV